MPPRAKGPPKRDDIGEAARSVSPHLRLSRIQGGGTGGRGPPAKDVSAHSGLEHEPIVAMCVVDMV
jgi:hypothetical protein